MEQLTLKIPVGGQEASSQKQANDAPTARVIRRRVEQDEGPQLRLYLPVIDDAKVVPIGRPLTIEQCEQRVTWLPYCPHVGCQYHLLIDIVNDDGDMRTQHIDKDDEFDLASMPRLIEEFDAAMLDPEDRPVGAVPGTMLRASVPMTCALRVARHVAQTKDGEMTFETIGTFLGVSKERIRQIANIAHRKGREQLLGDDPSLSPSDLLSDF